MSKFNGVSLLVLAVLVIPWTLSTRGFSQPAYRDATLSIERRLDDLLKRMTVEEKAAQLDMYWGREVTEDGKFSEIKTVRAMGTHGIGSVHDLYPSGADVSNQIQRYAIDRTRLGIPVLILEETLHGYVGKGSTTFPQSIAIASTWNIELAGKIGRAIATEARAHGVHMGLGPNLDLAREPRWGRTEETYGEDPYLAGEIGVAMVTGLQGNDLTRADAIVAQPKHFAVHGIPESGSNTSPVSVGEREARTSFLYVFERAVRKGGALAVMPAYHELDGVPCISNRWLLTDILRKEWGFQGFTLSDAGAIAMQINTHKTASSPKDAIIQALSAGVDMQFYDFEHDVFQRSIADAVRDGSLTMESLDRAARSVLRVKFLLGLFENPFTDVSLVTKRHHSLEHQELAVQAGRESICLLKNQNGLLPLKKSLKSIALFGPMANVSALGGYSPKAAIGKTVLQALHERFGGNATIAYEPGSLPNTSLTVVAATYLRAPDGKSHGLLGEYFNNLDVTGKPVFYRIDSNMTPYWDVSPPAPGVKADSFSVRWTGTITPPVSGRYEIGIITDDKGRLFLDNTLLVDNWENFQVNVMLTKEVTLKGGRAYPIRLEYADLTDFAGIRFKWRLVEADAREQNQPIARAVEVAKKSQVAIVVLGETEDVVGEGKDRADLDLDEHQTRLVKAVYATGTPTVVVLLNGRPLSVNWCAENVPAIVEGWYPGEAGGSAIVDVLFGEYNPSGRLPISFPKSVGQLPVYYNRKPSAKRSFVDADGRALFPFGHGLSYTTFDYRNLRIMPETSKVGDTVVVEVDLKNSGGCDGADVVQLYLIHPVSSVTTPIMTLKGFEKVFLKAGEVKSVRFGLTSEHLAIWNREMKRVVEPGDFQVIIGRSSEDKRLIKSFKVIQ